MLPPAWKRLGEQSRELVLYAHAQVCGAEAAERLRSAFDQEDSVPPSAGSRQGQHARMHRLLVGALSACSVVALEEAAVRRLFQYPDFAALRPNSADTHVRFGELMRQRGGAKLDLHATWLDQSAELMLRAPHVRTLDTPQLAVLHATLIPLFSCVILGGPAMREAWRELWRAAERTGALQSAGLRAHLAGMGSFAGEGTASFEVARHPSWSRADFCSALLLARRDAAPGLQETIAANLRGEELEPSACLYPGHPTSTVVSLARYVRGLMRQPQHFHAAGLILTLLRWIGEITIYVDQQRGDGSRDGERLLAELRRIEHVQVLEKNRFWHVVENMSDPEARAQLVQLWTWGSAGSVSVAMPAPVQSG